MRKSSPPKNPLPTDRAESQSDGELASEEWRTAFESPDDLWMRFLARAEKDESAGQKALNEWLTREDILEVAQHEWRLLEGAEPSSED